MCPCQPLDQSNFSLPAPVPPINVTVPQIPALSLPDIPLPINDLLALFNSLSMALPSGLLKPHLHSDLMKDVLSAIWSLLNQFLPFLALYKFFIPLLNLILCIIEILCSLMNPFKTARAISRLMRTCIPEFLNLFPFIALILMIIALIKLIILLIEYLIARILSIIALIIRNIEILINSAVRLDNDSILATLKKIGDLLCLLQNLFVIFSVIALIIEIAKAMLSLSFSIPPCDSSNGSLDGCCTPDVCPAFIKHNAANGITSNTGTFLYLPEIGVNSGLTLPSGFPPIIFAIRNESWQFYDPFLILPDQQFINITNAFDLPSGTNTVFFPGGVTYTSTSKPDSAPYTIDFRLFYNPIPFGVDGYGAPRFIRIKKAIISAPPTTGVKSYNNNYVGPFNGTLNLIGGTVTEDDGTPILKSDNTPYAINEFFHIPASGGIPQPTDGVLYSDLTYTFNINAEVLAGYALITMGCLPDVAANRDFINTTLGAQFNAFGANLQNIIPLLPDMNAAQQCVVDSVNKFRAKISPDSAQQFQTDVITCLNNLNNSATNALTAAVQTGFDQYTSTFTIDPIIQFTTYPIEIVVTLNEGTSNNMATNLPTNTATTIASQLSAIVSFGSVSTFTYDGYQSFTANIISSDPGNGTAKVLFNGNYISVLNNPSNIDIAPSVSIKELSYTFVETSGIVPEPQRDVDDIGREGG